MITPIVEVDILREALSSCAPYDARALESYFGASLLRTKPDELDGMVGNVATLLMAQTVCYIKSQGGLVESMRSDPKEWNRFYGIIKLCKDVTAPGKAVRR